MQGEYRGDFTRDTFDSKKHFLRVLSQQGRVTLDADFNEQVSILLHYLQTLASDLIGAHAGSGESFKIGELKKTDGTVVTSDFVIQPGHYYVDGILCENDLALAYTGQARYPLLNTNKLENRKTYLVYLDVWERHITSNEDDSIREVALGGPDTATRAKVVWQVKTTIDNVPSSSNTNWREWVQNEWDKLIELWQPSTRGTLKARVKPQEASIDPCITSPEARYRGAENQLYRVEIHHGGKVNDSPSPSFKWSRDNGSVVFPIRKLADKVVTLEHLGRDGRLSVQTGDWVEVLDDDYVLRGEAGPLVQIDKVDRTEMTVTLRSTPAGFTYEETRHPLLRRWDHKRGEPNENEPQLGSDGVLLIEEGKWLTLEDGVQILFRPASTNEVTNGPIHNYRSGDYWLIPARTASGDVEWPGGKDAPSSQPPHGVTHHYAPLAIIRLEDNAVAVTDLRRKIEPLGEPVP